jgi:predicted XRE-type DNA-binding protein
MTRSSGNVFADIGFEPEEAANLVLRSQLMGELSRRVARSKDLAGMARALGVRRARLDDLRRGRIERFDVDELVAWLGRLGTTVELKTRSHRAARARKAPARRKSPKRAT